VPLRTLRDEKNLLLLGLSTFKYRFNDPVKVTIRHSSSRRQTEPAVEQVETLCQEWRRDPKFFLCNLLSYIVKQNVNQTIHFFFSRRLIASRLCVSACPVKITKWCKAFHRGGSINYPKLLKA